MPYTFPRIPCPVDISSVLSCQHAIVDYCNVHSIEINPEARAATLSPFSASDEIDFALDVVRLYASHTLIITPLVWDPHAASLRSMTGVQAPLTGFTDFVVPLRVGRHWVQCDVFVQGQNLFVLFTNSLPNDANPQSIAEAFGRLFAIHESNVTFVASDVNTPEGMCGWSLIKRLFDRYRIPIPAVSKQVIQALSESQFSQVLTLILEHAHAAWADTTDDTCLRKLAFAVRASFLHRILAKPGPAEYMSAGAQDADATMTPALSPTTPVDPLTVHDPWAQAIRQSSKWEDLRLPIGHPFVDSANKPLLQIHCLQASKSRRGVILASKGAIADIMKVQPPAPSIIVMPAADVAVYGPLAARVHGPYEVVLEEQNPATRDWSSTCCLKVTSNSPCPNQRVPSPPHLCRSWFLSSIRAAQTNSC